MFFKLNNDVKKTQFKNSKILISTVHGIVRIELANLNEQKKLEDKYDFCVKDKDLNGEDSNIKIDLNKISKGPKLNAFKDEKPVNKER